MSIYTKTGDTGETGLFGGERVPKDDIRVEAYGAVDELNAFIGLTRTKAEDRDIQNLIGQIQGELFILGADLATPEGTPTRVNVPKIVQEQITAIEKAVDRFDEELEPLTYFILPDGTEGAALLHVARTVCRRAERRVVTLSRTETVNPEIITYLNRLSDLLFTLARVVNKRAGVTEQRWNVER